MIKFIFITLSILVVSYFSLLGAIAETENPTFNEQLGKFFVPLGLLVFITLYFFISKKIYQSDINNEQAKFRTLKAFTYPFLVHVVTLLILGVFGAIVRGIYILM